MGKRGRKAQYSMEFMLIFAFSLMVILPLVILLQSEYNQNKEVLNVAQARKVLGQISITAQKTYYAGPPSRNTIEVVFPAGITNISSTNIEGAVRRSEIIISVSRSGNEDTLVDVLPFWVNLSLSPSSGTRRLLLKTEDTRILNITDAP